MTTDTADPAGWYAGGLKSGAAYHTDPDCHHLDQSTRADAVTDATVERYGLRVCNACQRREVEEALDL